MSFVFPKICFRLPCGSFPLDKRASLLTHTRQAHIKTCASSTRLPSKLAARTSAPTHSVMPPWCPFASWEPRREACSVFECDMRVRSLGKREVSFGVDIRQWAGSEVRWSSEVPEGCQLVVEGNHSLPGSGSVSWVGVSHIVCSGEPGLKGRVEG